MANDHDTGYKLLFAAPEMVRDLLRGFAPQEWVKSADFTSLRRVNGSYVSDDLRMRHDDMVWKIRLRDEWLYVYLLLEFQSVPDRWMALRMHVYVGLLYQDLVARKELGPDGKLPPVLPIVLYNGRAPWSAADSLDTLLSLPPPGLARYRAQARYLLVDERRLAAAEAPLRNLAAALFRLEVATTTADFRSVTAHLVEWLAGEEHQRLRRAFAIWLNRRLRHRVPEANIPETDDLAEVHGMFPDDIIENLLAKEKKAARRARREARQEGRQEGRHEAQAAILRRLLVRRFGELPRDIGARIDAADADMIDAWLDRIFDAADLHAVFQQRGN